MSVLVIDLDLRIKSYMKLLNLNLGPMFCLLNDPSNGINIEKPRSFRGFFFAIFLLRG